MCMSAVKVSGAKAWKFAVLVICLAALAAAGLSGCRSDDRSFSVPLTVEERSGVDVEAAVISNGVPLPLGAVFDASDLKIKDKEGKLVDAGFTPLQKWQDGSWRFVQVSFLSDLKARDKSEYLLIGGKGGNPVKGISVQEDDDGYTVITGPLKFTVLKKGFNVIDQAWIDLSGEKNFSDENKIVDSHDRGIVVNIDGKEYTSSKGTVTSTKIERLDDVLAVIRTEGKLGNGTDEKLDYKLWIKAWAGSREVEINFNIAKKEGKTWDDYYNIGRISVDIPIITDGAPEFTFGANEGYHTGTVQGKAFIYQKSSSQYEFVNGQDVETVDSGKFTQTKNTGWAVARSGGKGLGVVYRWFWENFPSTISIDEKGVISAQVWSETHDPLKLYTGVAKTTDFRFYFHDDSEEPHRVGDRLKSFQLITIAQAPTSWYCQGTKAIDPNLIDLDLNNWPEEEHEYIKEYVTRFNEAYFLLLDGRRWGTHYSPGEDGYGFMNFGDGPIQPGDPIIPWSPEVTWWSNNYYDHPNIFFIHFFRTGDLKFLDYALQHEYHLMDIDTASYDPEDGIPGEYKSCPAVMHIKRYNQPVKDEKGEIKDYVFGDQGGHWHFQGVEGLFNAYYITGNSQPLERGLESADYALKKYTMNFDSQTRSIGHTLTGLAAAYRHTWDEKYLARMNWVWEELKKRVSEGPIAISEDIPYREEFKPYVYVRNWPFQTGILLGGVYKYRAFAPEVKGEYGIDNVSRNTLWVDIWERDTGKGYNSGWLRDANRWNYESDIMTSSGAWLHSVYPEKDFLKILRQAAINNVTSSFPNRDNKTFSQSFAYQWITQYEMAKKEVREKLYANFTAYPRKIKAGETVTFNNQSKGMKSCSWSFGDGGKSDSNEVNVTHTYKKPGTYDVRLEIRDGRGNREVLVIKDYIVVE